MDGTALLQPLATIIDFIFLTFSLWLGLYIVTRSPTSRVSWLAGATLWSLSGSFLNNLILLYFPPRGAGVAWWWGWSIAIAGPFWYHLSASLLPRERRSRRSWLTSLIYILALNLVAMEAYTPLIFERSGLQETNAGNSASIGVFYPLFVAYLIAVPLLAIDNFRYGVRNAASVPVRQRFRILIWASLLALLGALWGGLTTWLAPGTTSIVSDVSLGIAVLLLGYGVARWNALIEGHSARREFLYTSLAFGLVVGIYLGVAVLSNSLFRVPLPAILLIILLAIITHSLYDWARMSLDRWIYRGRRYPKLRADLREFAQSSPFGDELHERLQVLMKSLCGTYRASHGFIALAEDDGFELAAGYGAPMKLNSAGADMLFVGEATLFSPPKELHDAPPIAVLIPLRFGGQQMGVIAMGERLTGESYSEDELLLLEDFADIVAGVIHTANVQALSIRQIETLLREVKHQEHDLQTAMRLAMDEESELKQLTPETKEEALVQVEDALRHLHDYSHLGHQTLARLHLVDERLDAQAMDYVTHVDRGKALKEVLVDAIERLRPGAENVPPLPTREWHPYLILHDCYVQEKLNREVMGELYISEGTFNRTRRRALRTVTRALAEMESIASSQAGSPAPNA